MIICSLNFSPGLEKEIYLLGQLINKETGTEVNYLLDKRYKKAGGITFSKVFLDDHAIFYNASVKHFILSLLRKGLGRRNTFCLHEPHKESKAGYSLKTRLIVNIKEKITKLFGLVSDDFIVFSNYGKFLTQKYQYNKNILKLSLYRERNSLSKRKIKKIIFVGQVNGTKIPDRFIDLANSDVFFDYHFEIVSAAPKAKEFESERIEVFDGVRLSDNIIRKKMQSAAFVIIEHPNIVQSGVFADAIANGCFVLHVGQAGIIQYKAPEIMIDISTKDFKVLKLQMDNWFADYNERYSNFTTLYCFEFSTKAFKRDWSNQ